MEQTLNDEQGKFLLCYEVDPKLKCSFDLKLDKSDSNNGVDDIYTRLICGIATLTK